MTTVVMLPGMDGSGTLFDDFIKELGAKTLVIAYPPHRPLGYEALAALVEEQLPRDDDVIVLGESFSGPIAILLASKQLPNLRAVVLICTFAKMRDRPGPALLRWLICRLPFWRMPVRLGAPALLGSGDTPALREKLLNAVRVVRSDVWRTRMGAILSVDVTPQLRNVRVPMLYLQASEDRIVPPRAASMLKQAHANVEIKVIPGPHALLQTQSKACALALRSFARKHDIAL